MKADNYVYWDFESWELSHFPQNDTDLWEQPTIVASKPAPSSTLARIWIYLRLP